MDRAPVTVNRLKFDMDDIIFKVVSKDLTELQLQRLELVKQQLFTIDHTPDHPVYPVMIWEAITELDEEGGSTEDAISLFIMRKYDVSRVVHPAKLIEQLEKLVEKEEIIFTSENRYMLPCENSRSLVRLKKGKKRLGQHERDRRSNKLRKLDKVDQTQKDPNAILEAQSENRKLNGPPHLQIEGSARKNHLEEHMRVIEEQPPEVMKQFLEEEQQTQGCSEVLERFHENEPNEPPPGFGLEVFEKHKHVLEEVVEESEGQGVEVSEEQGLEMTGELLFHTNEGTSEAIEEDICGLHARVLDDQRLQEEIQAHRKESEATAAKSQLQLQAVNVIGDQVEAECQIKATGELCNVEHSKHKEIKSQTQPQVQQKLHVIEDCSQLEKSNVEAIYLHSETQRQEVEMTEEQKMLLEQCNVVAVTDKKKGLLELHNVGEAMVQEEPDDQTFVEEIQGHIKAVVPTGGQCQLQWQALDVAEDQVAAECQINETAELSGEEHAESGKMKCKPQSQVQESLRVEEHSQLQQKYIEETDLQNETKGQEVELTKEQRRLQEQYDEVPSNTNNLSNMLELFDKKSEQEGAMIMTPNSLASQKLDHVGLLLPSPSFKEKLIGLWKWMRETEPELKQVINYLSTVQVSKHNGRDLMIGEVQTKPGCKPRSSSCSVYLTTDSMQHEQNQKIELSNLKRTREAEITALEESSETQKRWAKPCNPQDAPKFPLKSVTFSPDLLIIDPEQHKMEKQRQEQQVEHPRTNFEDLQTPINLEHAMQRQQLDLPRLKTALEKILSAMEEFTISMDLCMDSEQVEHRLQLDCQISGTSHNLQPDLTSQDRPPGLEQLVEQSSRECLPQINLQHEAKKPLHELAIEEILIEERHVESKLTTVEQPSQEQRQEITLCHRAGNHECKLVKEKQLEISVDERPLEVEMAGVEQQCQMKQEIQMQPLRQQSQRASKSESGTTATAHDQQLQNSKHVQELKQQELKQLMVLDESSPMMKQQEMGCGQTQGKQERRQLRSRSPKPSGSDPAYFTNANDLDQTLSTIKLERKRRLEPPIHKRPQKKRAKKVDELSQLDKWEVDCHGKEKQLKSQLGPITSDEVQFMENSAAKDLVQTPQQQHPLRHQRRGRLPKQNSDMYRAEKEFPPSNGLNHCKQQPSQIRGRGRAPKASTSAQSTMREPESDHQNHGQQQSDKLGQGRPPKSILAAHKIVDVPSPPQHQSKQQEQQQTGQHHRSPPESKPDSAKTMMVTVLPSKHSRQLEQKKKPHGGNQGMVTRAKAAGTAAIISLLP